jgi:A/G-specific adenine glycosylase
LPLLRGFAAIIPGVAGRNPKSKIPAATKQSVGGRTPNLNRLVPLLLHWFAANARDLPWRRTRDPYAIWVSEIMLQQTQVKTVIPFWNRWMRELPTIESVAKASPAKIHKLWEGLGYYTRVRNLQNAAKQIQQSGKRKAESGNSRCKFPHKYDEVLALPGIGRYTAGAICSIAFNQPTPILDGNVIRVLTRIFGIADNPKEKETNARLWQLAEELVMRAARLNSSRNSRRKEAHYKIRNSQSLLTSAATIVGNCSALNQSLMELGALVCTPRNPRCPVCPAKKMCVAFRENRVEQLPNLGERATATARRFMAFIVESNGRFLVRQRPAGVVNGHLWEFPNVEVEARVPRPAARPNAVRHNNLSKDILQSRVPRPGVPRSVSVADTAMQILGFAPATIQPLCTIKHSITRFRITLEAFRVSLGGMSSTSPRSMKTKSRTRATRPSERGIWKSPAQMRRLAFTAAHKKLASAANNRILSAR